MNKGLRSYDELFGNSESEQEVVQIDISKLVPFKNHPFKLYSGKRLEDMVTSIKDNGVIVPIITRPMKGLYEILSGHNRINGAKIAGLEEVPCIILEDLSEDEALLIVTETNFNQRSFTDMLPSEKAHSLKLYYDTIRRQGRRADLNIDTSTENSTSTQVGYKLSLDKIAHEYELSRNSIARLLRLNKLIPELLDKVDDGRLPLMAAVHISYLNNEEQEEENKKLELGIDLSVSQAHNKRKGLSESYQQKKPDKNPGNNKKVIDIDVKTVSVHLKMPRALLKKIIKGDLSDIKINEVVIKALKQYSELMQDADDD